MSGRLSFYDLLVELREEVSNFRKHFYNLPNHVLTNNIWSKVWLTEVYHSLSIEGNPLNPKEIYLLFEQHRVIGNKEVWHHQEALNYAETARWVYENAVPKEQGIIPMTVEFVKELYSKLMGSLRAEYPNLSGEEPGEWHRGNESNSRCFLKPSSAAEIPVLMINLIDDVNQGPKEGEFIIEFVARIHAKFLKIAPFSEANGKVGRLLMNYLLIQRGYPPAVISKIQKTKYFRALEKANQGKPDYSLLTLLLARSIRENLSKLMLAITAPEPAKVTTEMQQLELLKDLANKSPYKVNYLRTLAEGGKLKAIKDEEGNWFSTEEYLKEYIDGRTRRGRRPKEND
ncbi:MAG: Fic family protein [Clostridia bacterium]|nr:Fic family protein [Clostridia bacterium]